MAYKVLPCPRCGQLNTIRRKTCKECGVDLSEARGEIEQQAESEPEVSSALQSEKLEQNIAHYVSQGYRIVSRTEKSAQLVRPKEFSFFAALLWFLVFVVGLMIYIFYYLAKSDDLIYLRVTQSGTVIVS